MIRIADYLTQDTVNFFTGLREKFSAEDISALGWHSRWLDHVTYLSSSALVFELEFACQNEVNRQEWFDACVAEGVMALFDQEGELKSSIRRRLAELAGQDENTLDNFLYHGLPKDQVHIQWLGGYCLSLMDRAYRALPSEFLVCPDDVDPNDFLPVTMSSWVNAQLAHKANHPELFNTSLRDAYRKRDQQRDSQLVGYWRRAQQCASEMTPSNASSQKTFLKAVRQLHMCLILHHRDQKGDEFSQDDVYEEYERIQKHSGAAVELSEAKAAMVSQICEGISLFSSGGAGHDAVIDYNHDLEEHFKDSSLDLRTEKNLLWHSLVCFASFGLKKQGDDGVNGEVLSVAEDTALIEPVVEFLKERKSHQDLAQWTVSRSPVSQSWRYYFLSWMLPDIYRLELEAHQIAALRIEDVEDKRQFYINRLNKMNELLTQCQCWMSRHEDLSLWEKLRGVHKHKRQVSVMGLMQTLRTEIKKDMHEIDVISDKIFVEEKAARDAINEKLPSPVKSPSSPIVKSASSLGVICASYFLLACLARWVPHPHMAHFAGLMMQLGFSGAAGVAYSRGWMSRLSLWQRQSSGNYNEAVSNEVVSSDVVSKDAAVELSKDDNINTEGIELSTNYHSP